MAREDLVGCLQPSGIERIPTSSPAFHDDNPAIALDRFPRHTEAEEAPAFDGAAESQRVEH